MKLEKNILISVYNTDIDKNGKFIIPDGVTSIGSYAFSNCTSLKKITIPDSIKSIGYRAFYGCTSLEKITIPDSVTSIGNGAFSYCTSLKEITIPDSVTKIGDRAFLGCTSLKKIIIPDSVTSIGSYAFYDCTSLKEITIPDSVTKIGNDAFDGCTSLEKITIPDSVTSIGSYAFYGCTSLTSINYKGNTLNSKCVDGYMMILKSSKQLSDYTIYKCVYFDDYVKEATDSIVYVAEKGNYAAHGETVKQAIADVTFKELQEKDVSEHIERVKGQGYITPYDYRLLTGACYAGTDRFLKEHSLTWEDTMPIDEAIKLVKGHYGSERFIKLLTE